MSISVTNKLIQNFTQVVNGPTNITSNSITWTVGKEYVAIISYVNTGTPQNQISNVQPPGGTLTPATAGDSLPTSFSYFNIYVLMVPATTTGGLLMINNGSGYSGFSATVIIDEITYLDDTSPCTIAYQQNGSLASTTSITLNQGSTVNNYHNGYYTACVGQTSNLAITTPSPFVVNDAVASHAGFQIQTMYAPSITAINPASMPVMTCSPAAFMYYWYGEFGVGQKSPSNGWITIAGV